MVIASELKSGMVVRIEGHLYKVLEAEFKAGAAKLSSLVKTKLRDVLSGRMWEPHFRSEERLEDVELEEKNLEFLYSDGDNCTFMDPTSFEQCYIPQSLVGPSAEFLQPGGIVPVETFEGNPISVILPEMVDVRVAETAPPAHSHQDSAWKQATLENGVRVRVPLFIAPGDLIRLEVSTCRYVERARAERKRA